MLNGGGRNKVERACIFAFSARMESLSAQQLSLRWRGKRNYLSRFIICVSSRTVINSTLTVLSHFHTHEDLWSSQSVQVVNYRLLSLL